MTRAEKLVRMLVFHEKLKFPAPSAHVNNRTAKYRHFVSRFKGFLFQA
jgi:hypothetical protein